MPDPPRWKRLLERYLSIGAYPDEPETRRSGRRVFLLAFLVATLLSVPPNIAEFHAGYTLAGVADVLSTFLPVVLLVAFALRPRGYAAYINVMLFVILLGPLLDTAMFGGLLPSGVLVIFGILVGLGALLAIGLWPGIFWFAVFVISVGYAVVIPHWVRPVYSLDNPTGHAAFNLISTGIVTAAAMIYFVRQRDRYQRRSDDLLHAMLPDEIAARLKDDSASIAEDVGSASVLFADVVDFTPMSAALSPSELVRLLDDVFTSFDGFVTELGLEKIKTVGDAYMVASGVPRRRDDHANAIAELALRIRDHIATNPINGTRLTFRIGINSGPLTAGVIGTHRFTYDLWGDTVNTASRMESSGVPGAIQVSLSTYELIKDRFVCEPRGRISIKGKKEMETYLLVSKRTGW